MLKLIVTRHGVISKWFGSYIYFIASISDHDLIREDYSSTAQERIPLSPEFINSALSPGLSLDITNSKTKGMIFLDSVVKVYDRSSRQP